MRRPDGMQATVLSCTLKKSPALSNSESLADEVIAGLESNGVEYETVRLVDLNIPRREFRWGRQR